MSELKPDATTEHNLKNMTDEDVTSLLDQVDPDEVEIGGDEPEESFDEDTSEIEVDAEGDETEEAPEEESNDEEAESEEGDEPEETADQLRERLAQAEAQHKKWEALAGRNAGRAGYLEQQLSQAQQNAQQLQAQMAARRDDPDYEAPRQAPLASPPQAFAADQAQAQIAAQAMQLASDRFLAENPDVAMPDTANPGRLVYRPEFLQTLNTLGVNVSDVLVSNDLNYTQNQTRLVLEAARRDMESKGLLGKPTRKPEEAEADAAADRKRRKKAATISKGTRATGRRPSKRKTIGELSDKELNAAVRRLESEE